MRKSIQGLLTALAAILTVTWLTVVPGHAQVLYGTITGGVMDATGGAIPGADVTVTNKATNYSQTAVTNDVGVYTLPNLPRGEYTLKVSLPGF